MESHRRQVFLGLAGLLVVIGAFFVYRKASETSQEAAAGAYLSARQAYLAGNYPLGASDLEGFLASYGDSRYAADAKIFLADAYFQSEQYTTAIEVLRGFLNDHSGSPLAMNARRLLGASYQANGEASEAVGVYREAIERTEIGSTRVELQLELARVLESDGQREEAGAAYQVVIDEASDEGTVGLARRKLAELSVSPLVQTGSEPDSE
jgi:TolA-binding protein